MWHSVLQKVVRFCPVWFILVSNGQNVISCKKSIFSVAKQMDNQQLH